MTALGKPIGFLLYEGCDLLDVAGPVEVFKFAQVQLQDELHRKESAPELLYFSPDGGPVATAQQLAVVTRPIGDIAGCNLDP
jgi:transcriptional regulator GlxA family with amidase domain